KKEEGKPAADAGAANQEQKEEQKKDEPKPEEVKKLSLQIVSLALSGRSVKPGDPVWSSSAERFLAHFREKQQEDGLWDVHVSRLPVFDSREMMTLLALWSLEIPELREHPEVAPLREKALAALAAAPLPEANQGLNYRLIAQTDIKGAKFNSARLQADIVKSQREDGGWSQTPEMASDAYATGQTLYAL